MLQTPPVAAAHLTAGVTPPVHEALARSAFPVANDLSVQITVVGAAESTRSHRLPRDVAYAAVNASAQLYAAYGLVVNVSPGPV